MKILQNYYGNKVMVFIDEYDTPFIEAHAGGFYEDIRNDLAVCYIHHSRHRQVFKMLC